MTWGQPVAVFWILIGVGLSWAIRKALGPAIAALLHLPYRGPW